MVWTSESCDALSFERPRRLSQLTFIEELRCHDGLTKPSRSASEGRINGDMAPYFHDLLTRWQHIDKGHLLCRSFCADISLNRFDSFLFQKHIRLAAFGDVSRLSR
jgi:hypothetical protein